MVLTIFTVVTTVLLGSVLCQSPTDKPKENITEIVLKSVVGFLEDDGFNEVATKEPEKPEERKKRSLLLGHVGGYGDACGAYPLRSVNFVRCFTPGQVFVQRRTLVQSYYRQGGYGQCLNYFRSLPLTNVATVAAGYVGQLGGLYGRTYTVNACENCYGGYPGISIRCNSRPYSYLVRRFVFQPQINNINVNNYNGFAYQPYSGYAYSGSVYAGGVYGGYSYDSSPLVDGGCTTC
ncbi:hypothetical protein SNE40_005562 [Patella caerulea]|uniref:Uncharacterized protein n=1 Tax=Patella caerulea TaxID=87958 RepID=A0AAN8KAJ6_PATCE